jgi:magnesium chelatase family protein
VAGVLARVTTFAITGIDPRRVTVEVDLRVGLPSFTIVGLGDRAVREARERVRAAVLNSGFEFPARRLTVNLAPASLRKAGPGFDLAIATAVLAASGQVPAEALERFAVFGELSLGGELRPLRGVLAVAEGTLRAGLSGLVVPRERAAEAALVDGLDVVGAA